MQELYGPGCDSLCEAKCRRGARVLMRKVKTDSSEDAGSLFDKYSTKKVLMCSTDLFF